MTAPEEAGTPAAATTTWDGVIRPVNPTTAEPLPDIEATTATGLDGVLAAADYALASWKRSAAERTRILRLWADALRAEATELAHDLVIETGKPLREARAEIAGAADCLDYNAGLVRYLDGSAGLLPDGTHSHLVREPLGVSAFLVPWNWPVMLLFRDLSPALATGVTAVVKPAPQTSHITGRVVEIGYRVGVPSDVVSVVYGDVAVAQHLLNHRAVRAVAFTGSTRVGEIVLASAARNMVRPLLELGGKNPAVVFPDADLTTALPALARAAVITSGQMCMACSRLLVHRSIYDQALATVRETLASMTLGDPMNPATDLGPLISAAHAGQVSAAIETARRHHDVSGGAAVQPQGLAGHFIEPAVVAQPDPESAIVHTDVFGPVLTVEAFDDEDHAIALANTTVYGLVAGVWTADSARALRISREIHAGTVWINGWGKTYPEVAAGGFKSSGLGRTRGIAGLHQFTELKHIHIS